MGVMHLRPLLFLTASALLLPLALSAAGKQDLFVYIGTYTRDDSKGIYLFRFDSATGALTPVGVAAETPNPSFVALSPDRKFLYAVSEVGEIDGQKGGAVSAFARNPQTGVLTFLNRVSSKGSGPCHVTVDRAGRNVLVANYGSGSVAVLPREADGKLREASSFEQHTGSGADPQRQKEAHAHSVNMALDNRYAVAADLGEDRLYVYRFDAGQGKLMNNEPPFAQTKPGAGPRHFAFHPTGRYGYAINELTSTVTAYTYDRKRGVLTDVQTVTTLPSDFQGNNSTAEVQVHPSGKFLYGSNRGHDSIAVFTIDRGTGKLTPVQHVPTQGKNPRNFGIDPSGKFLIAANQNSSNLVVYRIDAGTGKLTPTGQEVKTPWPVCVKFVK